MSTKAHHKLTLHIVIALITGGITGLIFNQVAFPAWFAENMVNNVFDTIGTVFIHAMRMLVVPLVFVSLVVGTASLGDTRRLGTLATKTVFYFFITTLIALVIALLLATSLNVGKGTTLTSDAEYIGITTTSLKDVITNIFPTNPFLALTEDNMLQVIFFAMFLGITISLTGRPAEFIKTFFTSFNDVMMKMVMLVMHFAPYGVFCLMAVTFANLGFDVVRELFLFVIVTVLAMVIHVVVVYTGLLKYVAKLPIKPFLMKMRTSILFAFSSSSSNATLPIVMETVEHKLGVNNSVAAFTLPLGTTVNMDGTAIMQAVATVFIANIFGVDLTLTQYFLILITATLASVGTAGTPGSGTLILAMILTSVGLPPEGVGLVIGVDRLTDMFRTAVNVMGNATVTCVIAKSEKALDQTVYNNLKLED